MLASWKASLLLALVGVGQFIWGQAVAGPIAVQNIKVGEASVTPVAATAVSLGVYDPNRAFHAQAGISIEHYFLSWYAVDRTWVRSLFRYATQRNRQLLVTVEPFRAPGATGTPTSYLRDIAAGKYNGQIYVICRLIGEQASPVLVRWGHEMDDTSGRYPWAGADPAAYIGAFRVFRNVCRRSAPMAKFIWSPMASKDPKAYYPGYSFVDYVGLPIWGLQQVDKEWHGGDRSFTQLLSEKYQLVSSLNKPVIVAESGVSGDPAYKDAVLSGIQMAKAALPLLTSVVYFNMKEPFPWWGNYGTPDWTVEPGRFVSLARGGTLATSSASGQ